MLFYAAIFTNLCCCRDAIAVLHMPAAFAFPLPLSKYVAAPRHNVAPHPQNNPARETLLIFPTPGGKVGVHVDSTFLDTDPPSVIGLWVCPPAHTPR